MSGETSGGSCRVALCDEAKADVRHLRPSDGSRESLKAQRRLADAVVKTARQIESHPWLGDPLREDGPISGIGGLRKVAIDPENEKPPALRIVYRLEPEGEHPRTAEIIAIGPRRNMRVYLLAARRVQGR